MNTLTFPYNAKQLPLLISIAFFGTGAFFMGRVASRNVRGLILNQLVHVDAPTATIVLWCAATVLFVFAGLAASVLVSNSFSTRRLEVTEATISAPKFGFSWTQTVIQLEDVHAIEMRTINGRRYLNVHHCDGHLAINESLLANSATFDLVRSEIGRRSGLIPDLQAAAALQEVTQSPIATIN